MPGSGISCEVVERSPPMRPGHTQLTVMLRFANSAASPRVNPSSPAFAVLTCTRPR